MKTTTLLIAALVTLLFTSCAEQQTPEQAVEAFSNAYETNDWETAKKNATTHGIDQLESAESSLLNMFDDLVILGTNVNETEGRIIENINCPENAETSCECTVTFKNKETVVYKLVHEGEFWKVDFELSKGEQILNNITDFVDEAVGDEINKAVDQALDKGIDMAKDSLLNAIGF
jgi:hypothetical protein|tara:strand:- start:265 stop:789 length:525 start_codon:yes stop_codon:yes gene_type:complete